MKQNSTSIFLFSETSKKCVELKTSAITPSDLVDLQRLLPRNLKGVSFHKPDEEFIFRSEARELYVSKYLTEVGQSLLNLGEPLGALRFFDFSLKIENNPNLKFLLLRAKALLEIGQVDEAFTDVKRVLKEEPENGLAHFILGKVYLYRNDYQKANHSFEKVFSILPKEDSHSEFSRRYIELNQLFIQRDSLYARNLSSKEWIQEIEFLREKSFPLLIGFLVG